MSDKIELNSKNPIFAVYVNISGLTRQRANEILQNYIDNLNIYSNITMWFIPMYQYTSDSDTRIELIYNGDNDTKNAVRKFALEINKALDLISESNNFDDFKSYIRQFRLDNLINE